LSIFSDGFTPTMIETPARGDANVALEKEMETTKLSLPGNMRITSKGKRGVGKSNGRGGAIKNTLKVRFQKGHAPN